MAKNVRRAIETADIVLLMTDVPFIPHLTHFWEIMSHHDYEEWLSYDKQWLLACDGLLRLSGDSPGADREEAWATNAGLKVWHGIDEYTDDRLAAARGCSQTHYAPDDPSPADPR